MYKQSLLCLSLMLTACGTSNNTDVNNTSDSRDTVPTSDSGDTISTSVSIAPTTTKTPAKELEVTNGSVVFCKKHVIVNAANPWLAPGGVLSGAIFSAAGEDKVLAEIASKHDGVSHTDMSGDPLLQTSEVFTTGAYDLSAQGTQYIIHALGPNFTIAPYNSNMEQGYTDLRKTYQNVYAEMERLNKEHQVTTIGIIPISSGVFAGKSDRTKLYQIFIDETLDAMQKYPELQPELYLYDKSSYDAVKSLLKSTVAQMKPSATLSLGSVAQASQLALLDASVHKVHVGTFNFHGGAASLGSLRVMGGIVEGVNERLTQFTVGRMNQGSFLGWELETAYRDKEFSHYVLKASGAVQISDSLKLGGGIGYTYENMAANLSHKMLNFLNLDSKDYERNGVVCDVVAQHQATVSSTLSFTTSVGIRAGYVGTKVISPFVSASCTVDGLGVSAILNQHEVGLRFDLKN